MSALLVIALVLFLLAVVQASVLGGWRDQLLGYAADSDTAAPGAPSPGVVAIVPVRNGEATLAAVLQDLHAQQGAGNDFSVVVVDDHSTDRTWGIAQAMARSWPALRVISADGCGKKAAITTGVRASDQDLVLITDADARCGPHRVKALLEFWSRVRPAMILMPVRTAGAEPSRDWLQAEEQWALQAVTMGSALAGSPVLANGANMAFTREAFERVGGYVGDGWASGDDVFLLGRMRSAGLLVACLPIPDVTVTVEPESRLAAWWSQRLRWAGKMRASGQLKGALAVLITLAVPWALLVTTGRLLDVRIGGQVLYTSAFLLGAWLAWYVPVLRLVFAYQRMQQRPVRPVRTTLALVLFLVYAPLIGIASMVVRPHWKGRRI